MATDTSREPRSGAYVPRWGEEPVEKIIAAILAAPRIRYEVHLSDEAMAELDAL